MAVTRVHTILERGRSARHQRSSDEELGRQLHDVVVSGISLMEGEYVRDI